VVAALPDPFIGNSTKGDMAQTHQITELLEAWSKGDLQALDKLLPLVDHELRKLAHAYMSREKPWHTLQTTALVNEALIRLIGREITWTSRKQFYALVAKRMRQVLTDHARAQLAARRGGRPELVAIDDVVGLSDEKSREMLMLDEALTKLGEIDERKAKIVEYRYFGGFTLEEVAEILEIAPATIERQWRLARSWLKQQMTGQSVNEHS
jgi:RNA polymerase sigma-70 factor, ECF subfamily